MSVRSLMDSLRITSMDCGIYLIAYNYLSTRDLPQSISLNGNNNTFPNVVFTKSNSLPFICCNGFLYSQRNDTNRATLICAHIVYYRYMYMYSGFIVYQMMVQY